MSIYSHPFPSVRAEDPIKPGARVRSFDFDSRDLTGPRACYIEGTVTALREVEGCVRYVIRVERTVFAGEENPFSNGPEEVIPPVNGTLTTGGRKLAGVVLLEEAPEKR